MGIKGASVLCTQPSFNLCTGVVIDAMHCIFLGLMEKTLMGFWFGTSHRGSPYSIRTKVNYYHCMYTGHLIYTISTDCPL